MYSTKLNCYFELILIDFDFFGIMVLLIGKFEDNWRRCFSW